MAGMWGAHTPYQVNPQPSFPQAQSSGSAGAGPAGGYGGALVQSSSRGQGGFGTTGYAQPQGQSQGQQMAQWSGQGAASQSQSQYQGQGQMMLSQQHQQQQQAGPSGLRYSQQGQQQQYNDNPPQQSLVQQNQPSQYQQQQLQQQQNQQQLVQRPAPSVPAPIPQQSTAPSQAPPTVGSDELTAEERALYEPLEAASRQISQAREDDEKIVPAFDTYLTANISTQYDIPDPDVGQPFVKTQTYQLPQALFQKFDMKSGAAAVAQGLFPQIARAWFTINEQLYLWNWATDKLDRCDDGSSDRITSVGLARAKRHVISDDIQHILVICSIKSVILLGLSIVDSQIQVYSLPGLKLDNPSGTYMTSVRDTADGRLFFTGSDRCLHEFQYSKDSSWLWGSLCSWKNHTAGGFSLLSWGQTGSRYTVGQIAADSERGFLYILTQPASNAPKTLPEIQVYQLKENGLEHCSTASNLVQTAQQWTAASVYLDVTKGVRVVSINVVGPEISSEVHLVAVTSTGARLYYSMWNRRDLRLRHVHLPADAMTHAYMGQNKEGIAPWNPALSLSRTSSGVFLLVTGASEQRPASLILSSQSIPRALAFQQTRSMNPSAAQEETFASILQPEGRIISDIGELPHATSSPGRVAGTVNARSDGRIVQSELVTEVTEPEHRRFLVLAHDGLDVIVKARPIDVLCGILRQDSPNMRAILEKWSAAYAARPVEVCALTIGVGALACTAQTSDAAMTRAQLPSAQSAADWLRLYIFDLEKRFAQSQGAIQEINQYRERGLAQHLARVLRPIWTRAVIRQNPAYNQYETAMSAKELQSVQRNLEGLRQFVTSYPSGFGFEQDGYLPQSVSRDLLKQRKIMFDQLVKLIDQAVEAISFVLLLIDFNLPATLARVSPQLAAELGRISYSALVTTKGGREIAKQLVTSLMQQQIGQQVSIDTITRTLQSRCGSFCRPEDVILYKAMECIRKAKDSKTADQRERFLTESLQLFLQSIAAISKERVRDVCMEYRKMQFPQGAIRLPLASAHQTDLEGRAVAYWSSLVTESLEEATDAGRASFDRRLFFYNLITESLDYFQEAVDEQLENGVTPGGVDAERVRSVAFDVALASEDKLFHMHLYDWMVKHGEEDQLLQLTNESVEEYLQHKLQNGGEHINPDLLWKYYARRGQHRSAAHALSHLATSAQLSLPLDVRVQYLSAALANAKSSVGSARAEERATVSEITDLEERSEVANVQAEVWSAVAQQEGLDDDVRAEKLAQLERRLLDIQTLYNKFAEPFELLQCQLLILHISDYRDAEVVEDIWARLLDEAVTARAEETVRNIQDVVVPLGRRFYPSPAALPFDFIFRWTLLQAYNLRDDTPSGWAVRMFREANIPWQDTWEAIMGVRGGEAPFGEPSGMQYIDEQLSVMLPLWLQDHQNAAMQGDVRYFPASDVDAHLNAWLMDHSKAQDEADERVRRLRKVFVEVQSELRRRF